MHVLIENMHSAVTRDGIGGYWMEHNLGFDASLMKAGTNTLTIPAGSLTSGILYDYLRLELDTNATPAK